MTSHITTSCLPQLEIETSGQLSTTSSSGSRQGFANRVHGLLQATLGAGLDEMLARPVASVMTKLCGFSTTSTIAIVDAKAFALAGATTAGGNLVLRQRGFRKVSGKKEPRHVAHVMGSKRGAGASPASLSIEAGALARI
jgi:hypothetical protein